MAELVSVFIYFLLLPCIQTFGCYFFWLLVDLVLVVSHLIFCSPASQIMNSIRIVYKIRLLIKVRIWQPVLMLFLQCKVHGLYDSSFDISKSSFFFTSWFQPCSEASLDCWKPKVQIRGCYQFIPLWSNVLKCLLYLHARQKEKWTF